MVKYRPLNQLNSFAALGTFDITFCRNVLIYFALPEARRTEPHRKCLQPDGYLVLGGAETVVGATTAFAPVSQQRNVYAFAGRPAVAA